MPFSLFCLQRIAWQFLLCRNYEFSYFRAQEEATAEDTYGILLYLHTSIFKSRDSSVGIAIGYGLDDRCSRVRFPAGTGIFSLHSVQNGFGAHPASYPRGTGAVSLEVKRPGCETDHSPPFSAEVKEWVGLYIHSPIHLHGVALS
jgi:hypothetical protein